MSEPVGRPQGGFKSEAGKAAYWRLQYESAIGALADLIAEHTEDIDARRQAMADLRVQVETLPIYHSDAKMQYVLRSSVLAVIDRGSDG